MDARPTPPDLSYGELLRLTEGHGTSEIYERVSQLERSNSELAGAIQKLLAAIDYNREAGGIDYVDYDTPKGKPLLSTAERKARNALRNAGVDHE